VWDRDGSGSGSGATGWGDWSGCFVGMQPIRQGCRQAWQASGQAWHWRMHVCVHLQRYITLPGRLWGVHACHIPINTSPAPSPCPVHVCCAARLGGRAVFLQQGEARTELPGGLLGSKGAQASASLQLQPHVGARVRPKRQAVPQPLLCQGECAGPRTTEEPCLGCIFCKLTCTCLGCTRLHACTADGPRQPLTSPSPASPSIHVCSAPALRCATRASAGPSVGRTAGGRPSCPDSVPYTSTTSAA